MKSVGDVLKKITTEHGAYIAIAVVGFISSLVGLFINVNGTISIKWLIAAVCVSLTAIVILIRALVASVDRILSKKRSESLNTFPQRVCCL